MARSEPAFWIIFKLCKVSSCSKYIWIFWINTFWLINQDKPQGPQLEYLKTHCNCPKLLLLERISKANRQNYKTSRGRKQHNKYEKLLFQVAFKIKWLNFTNIDFFFFPPQWFNFANTGWASVYLILTTGQAKVTTHLTEAGRRQEHQAGGDCPNAGADAWKHRGLQGSLGGELWFLFEDWGPSLL